MSTNQNQFNKAEVSQFAKDVQTGLGQQPKSIPSKYFYDSEGDRIFQQIMEMKEYYLTACETEILKNHSGDILEAANMLGEPFNLIELGAGDGLKTKILLAFLFEQQADFTYYPVDISASILDELKHDLHQSMPGFKVEPMHMDYFVALNAMKKLNQRPNLILFLGSNIGNFRLDQASLFLEKLAESSNNGDKLLLGVDLKKESKIIINAYDDPHGITAAFNLNLLSRMNRELQADFNIEDFSFYTYYEEETGELRSYLKSLKKQLVSFNSFGIKVSFEKDELIHTETSKKYSLEELESLAAHLDFEVVHHFTDTKSYFTDTLWKVSKH